MISEKELKETFGIKVKLPVGFINYRAYEESIKGIEVEIKTELMHSRKQRLYKIRNSMRKILNEL